MPNLIEEFNKIQFKKVPEIRPGDIVRVHQKIKEGDKERIQIFEGVVIARKHGKGINSTITVRKVVDGVGVERIFPVHSPLIEKFEVVKHSKVKRAKLYYLRKATGRKARLKNREEFAIGVTSEKISEKIKEKEEENQNQENLQSLENQTSENQNQEKKEN